MDRNVSPCNSHIEALTANVTVIGHRGFKEATRVKLGPKDRDNPIGLLSL